VALGVEGEKVPPNGRLAEVTWCSQETGRGLLEARSSWDRMQNPPTSEYVRGALYGFAAVCIWAAFIVVSRLGVSTSLTPWDVAAIRFTVVGALLFPYVMTIRSFLPTHLKVTETHVAEAWRYALVNAS
jgi:drug/metabolite transporter (DMT)-like permease